MKNQFGGLWTRTKLDLLNKYLSFYTEALKNTPFQLHFVDAFAGTGNQSPKVVVDQDDFLPDEDLRGSVRIALDITRPFHQYHFNDLNPDHVQAIEEIKAEHPEKTINISKLDANEFVPRFCKSMNWNDRAVLFLDPFSTELDWQTLQHVAGSKKIDLWLLFPISAILRMTPKDGSNVKPEWKATIDRLLGTSDWEQALYKLKPVPKTLDLFESKENDVTERINWQELSRWVTQRLNQEFAYVADPVSLDNNGRPLFLFFFAVSNPNSKAQNLANKVVRQIIKDE